MLRNYTVAQKHRYLLQQLLDLLHMQEEYVFVRSVYLCVRVQNV